MNACLPNSRATEWVTANKPALAVGRPYPHRLAARRVAAAIGMTFMSNVVLQQRARVRLLPREIQRPIHLPVSPKFNARRPISFHGKFILKPIRLGRSDLPEGGIFLRRSAFVRHTAVE